MDNLHLSLIRYEVQNRCFKIFLIRAIKELQGLENTLTMSNCYSAYCKQADALLAVVPDFITVFPPLARLLRKFFNNLLLEYINL
jgi:hypothetical protein